MEERLAQLARNNVSEEGAQQQQERPVPHDGGTFGEVANRLKGHISVVREEAELIETSVENSVRSPSREVFREAARRLRFTGRFMAFELDRLIAMHDRLERSQVAAPGRAVGAATTAHATAAPAEQSPAAASGSSGSSSPSGPSGSSDRNDGGASAVDSSSGPTSA
ncbi:hypothetical protein VTH82DRAFT_4810 [Thermothelomyces myriococcoides]